MKKNIQIFQEMIEERNSRNRAIERKVIQQFKINESITLKLVCLDESALIGYMVGARITAEGHSEGMVVRLPPEVYGKEPPEKDSATAEKKHPSDIPYNALPPFVMVFLALVVLSIGGLTARYGRRYTEKRERERRMERSKSLREMVETILLEKKTPLRATQGKITGTEEFTERMRKQNAPRRRAPDQKLKGTEEFTHRILNASPKDHNTIKKTKPATIPFHAFGIVRTVKEKQ